MTQPTHEDTIAYEAGIECITHLMSLVSGELFGPEAHALSEERTNALRRTLEDLAAERRCLRLSDARRIAQIREQYGGLVRQFSKEPLQPIDLEAIRMRLTGRKVLES